MTRKATKTQRRRAVGYVRVSSVRGREGDSFLSPEVQREKIEAWASYRGYSLERFYVDLDESGRTMKRPEFERLMSDARSGAFDVVAVYRLTRFARNIKGASIALDELVECGVDLVSVTEDLDTTTAGGKLMRNMLLAMAEFESERIGEEWRNVHAARRNRGVAHVANGLFGYDVARATIVGINETEAQAVRLMYDMRLRGSGHGAIRRALFAQGFRPRSGHTYFSLSSIKYKLANPLYAGLIPLNGELVAAQHDPIIPLDQWRAVNALRKRLKETSKYQAGLLSGIAVCANCGHSLKYERRKGSTTVYRCVAKRSSSIHCPRGASITAAPLEEYVTQALLLSHARFKRQRHEAIDHGATVAKRHRGRLDEIQRTLDQLTSRLGAAEPLLFDEYERQIRQLVLERESIEEVIAESAAETQNVTQMPSDEEWATMEHDVRRQTIRGLVRRIVVSPATSVGGRSDRGVDVEARVRFEMTLDDQATNAAIGKALYDAIDWEATSTAASDGLAIAVKSENAEALRSSPFTRGDLLI